MFRSFYRRAKRWISNNIVKAIGLEILVSSPNQVYQDCVVLFDDGNFFDDLLSDDGSVQTQTVHCEVAGTYPE